MENEKPKQANRLYDDLPQPLISTETYNYWDKVYEEALDFLHARTHVPIKENIKEGAGSDPFRDNSKQQDLFEEMHGYRIKAERPHEFAVALVLRPFSKPALPSELPQIVESGFAPGYHFIGLEKEGTRVISTSINIQYYTPRHIRTETDLREAVTDIWKRTGMGLSFFEASDELWQRVVQEFARLATVIVADVSEASQGLEWEIEQLVPLYREKFMCFAIDSGAAPFGPFKSKLSNDVKIVPIIGRYNQTLSQYTFLDFVQRRHDYDAETSRNFLHQLIDTKSWANDFWSGVTALGDGKIAVALEQLSRACGLAAVAGDWPLSVYPGIALAETMTWAGLREPRRRLLLLLARGKTDESCLQNKSRHELLELDVDLIRKVLKLSEIYPELPLAIWQYTAMLLEGLSREILLRNDLAVAQNFLPYDKEDFESIRQRINDDKDSSERLKIDMAAEHAGSALKLSAAFRFEYGEMLALLYAIYAWFILGENEACRKYASRGIELALKLGEQRVSDIFSFYLHIPE